MSSMAARRELVQQLPVQPGELAGSCHHAPCQKSAVANCAENERARYHSKVEALTANEVAMTASPLFARAEAPKAFAYPAQNQTTMQLMMMHDRCSKALIELNQTEEELVMHRYQLPRYCSINVAGESSKRQAASHRHHHASQPQA